MNGQRQDGTPEKVPGQEPGKDQAAGKPEQGTPGRDDELSKAQEDAARERAENGGYQ